MLNCDIGKDTTGFLFDLIRSYYIKYFNQRPFRLEKTKILVQIDESNFRYTLKYHQGRTSESELWVFGGLEYQLENPIIALKPVPSHSKTTMKSAIREIIHGGTEIWSDSFASYNGFSSVSYVPHRTVNHPNIDRRARFIIPGEPIHKLSSKNRMRRK